MIDFTNRIDRLAYILTELSDESAFSTPKLVKITGMSQKIIQTDFRDYLLPLLPEIITYDARSKHYVAKAKFLYKTLLSAQELAVFSVLLNKSKDNYSPEGLTSNVQNIMKCYSELKVKGLYQNIDVDEMPKIAYIAHAIENKYCIFFFTGENILLQLMPIRLYKHSMEWYLFAYDDVTKYQTYPLKQLSKPDMCRGYGIDECYEEKAKQRFAEIVPGEYQVRLHVQKEAVHYFHEVLDMILHDHKTHHNDSISFTLLVEDLSTVIPLIQMHLPYVQVLSPIELKQMIREHIERYLLEVNRNSDDMN